MANQLRKEDVYHPFDKTDLEKRVDYNSTANPLYIGYAQPGSAEGSAAWQICKCTHDANNNVTKVEWASGSNLYDKIWTSRTTYFS